MSQQRVLAGTVLFYQNCNTHTQPTLLSQLVRKHCKSVERVRKGVIYGICNVCRACNKCSTVQTNMVASGVARAHSDALMHALRANDDG